MTNKIDKKLYFQGENLLLKHLHKCPQGTSQESCPILETLTFFRVGLTSPSQSLDYEPSWKASYRYVERFLLKIQSGEDGKAPVLQVEHLSPEGEPQGDTQNGYSILVADWEDELQEDGVPATETLLSLPESVLIFIVGEYSDGHRIKLGEMTQGRIDGQIYRRLQREMTEILLNPDWEEVLWIF